MKKIFPFLCVLSLLFSVGCDDSTYVEVDGLAPVVTITNATITSEAGRTFVIEGNIKDADGIATIALDCPEICLGKVIDIDKIYADSTVTDYELAYKFTADDEEIVESDVFTIAITVTDLGGRETAASVDVTMDGDFTAPKFVLAPGATVSVLQSAQPSYNLRFTVSDDKNLKSVNVKSESLNIDETVEVEGFEYSYAKPIVLPADLASYEVVLTVTDAADLTTSTTTTLVVSELQNFGRIYLTEGDDPSVLTSDIMGIPMAVLSTGDFQYTARFYNTVENNEIYFIPQKNDLEPICFGTDVNDSTKLGIGGSPADVNPIILAEAGKYYEIVVNTKECTYTAATYTPTDDYLPYGNTYYWWDKPAEGDPYDYTLAMFVNGVEGYGWGQRGEAMSLAQNPDNLYEVFADFEITDYNDTYGSDKSTPNPSLDGHMKFSFSIKRYDGWWNDPTGVSSIKWEAYETLGLDEPEVNVIEKEGGSDASDPGFKVPAHGKYRVVYDSHLHRTRVFPIE